MQNSRILVCEGLAKHQSTPWRHQDYPGATRGLALSPHREHHLGPELDILVPDLAGWRREQLPEVLGVFRLDGDSFRVVHTWRGNALVRAEPFDAIELDLSILWAR